MSILCVYYIRRTVQLDTGVIWEFPLQKLIRYTPAIHRLDCTLYRGKPLYLYLLYVLNECVLTVLFLQGCVDVYYWFRSVHLSRPGVWISPDNIRFLYRVLSELCSIARTRADWVMWWVAAHVLRALIMWLRNVVWNSASAVRADHGTEQFDLQLRMLSVSWSRDWAFWFVVSHGPWKLFMWLLLRMRSVQSWSRGFSCACAVCMWILLGIDWFC